MRSTFLGQIMWKGFSLVFLAWFFYAILGYSVVYSRYFTFRVTVVAKENMSLRETFIHLDRELSDACQSQADNAGGIVAGIGWLRSRPQVRVLFPAGRWQGILADLTRKVDEKRRRS
ncbi:MAG: hypothetical protein QGH40_10735 [bacterium]|nr:hypothetical protein [bacterium]